MQLKLILADTRGPVVWHKAGPVLHTDLEGSIVLDGGDSGVSYRGQQEERWPQGWPHAPTTHPQLVDRGPGADPSPVCVCVCVLWGVC